MLIRELFEASTHTHVSFCFGRLNPPTIGHKTLLKTIAEIGGDYEIFVSQTQDKKKNPLDYATKIEFMQKMFPEYASHIVVDPNLNTILKVASSLYNKGYRQVTLVAGSDRLDTMQKLLQDYNGVEGKAHGYYKFELIDAKSSGNREDGAEGVSGISASNARLAAANGDFDAFKESTGAGDNAISLYKAVREGLGIHDTTEDAAGVGIVTKQNTTKDVNKGTLRKMMKAYHLTDSSYS